MNSIARIIHLSDIHFDLSTSFEVIKNQPSYTTALQLMREQQPDYFIVSGDFFKKGPQDCQSVTAFLEDLARLTKSKRNDHIVLCPGNHDFYLKKQSIRKRWKFRRFLLELSDKFITPFCQEANGHRAIFDPQKKIIIYPLNSCPISSKEKDHIINQDPDNIKEIINSRLFTRLDEYIRNKNTDITKIVVLHHNIKPISYTDSIAFESNRLTGMLEHKIASLNVDLVLHGHAHEKTKVIDISNISDDMKISILPVGSLFGAEGVEGSFNIIDIVEETREIAENVYTWRLAIITLAEISTEPKFWHRSIVPMRESISPSFSIPNLYFITKEINLIRKKMVNLYNEYQPVQILLDSEARDGFSNYYQTIVNDITPKPWAGPEHEASEKMVNLLELDDNTQDDIYFTSCGIHHQYDRLGDSYFRFLIKKLIGIKKNFILHNLFFIPEEHQIDPNQLAYFRNIASSRKHIVDETKHNVNSVIQYKPFYMVVPDLRVIEYKGIFILDYAVALKTHINEDKHKLVLFNHLRYEENYHISFASSTFLAERLKSNFLYSIEHSLSLPFI